MKKKLIQLQCLPFIGSCWCLTKDLLVIFPSSLASNHFSWVVFVAKKKLDYIKQLETIIKMNLSCLLEHSLDVSPDSSQKERR